MRSSPRCCKLLGSRCWECKGTYEAASSLGIRAGKSSAIRCSSFIWVLSSHGRVPGAATPRFCPLWHREDSGELLTGQSGRRIGCSVYSHLDSVFLMVINEGDGTVGSVKAVNCHCLSASRQRGLANNNMIDSLAITVVHLEFFPWRRQTGREAQFIHLKS